MGRTDFEQNRVVKNPAQFFFDIDGSEGFIYYYDKETAQNIQVDLPFTFLLLEERRTIKGFSQSAKRSFYSNEMPDDRSSSKIPFRVQFFGQKPFAVGTWNEIKDVVKNNNGHLAKVLYIAVKVNDGYQVAALVLKSSSFGEYLEFFKKLQISQQELDELGVASPEEVRWKKAISIVGFDDRKNGGIRFKVPVFSISEVTDSSEREAVRLYDNILKPYIESYDNINNSAVYEKEEASETTDGEEDNTDEESNNHHFANQHPDDLPY